MGRLLIVSFGHADGSTGMPQRLLEIMYHSLTEIAWHRQPFSRNICGNLIETRPSIDIFRNICPEKKEVMQRNISADTWAGFVLCFSFIPGA
jgi:hypothetical protein